MINIRHRYTTALTSDRCQYWSVGYRKFIIRIDVFKVLLDVQIFF